MNFFQANEIMRQLNAATEKIEKVDSAPQMGRSGDGRQRAIGSPTNFESNLIPPSLRNQSISHRYRRPQQAETNGEPQTPILRKAFKEAKEAGGTIEARVKYGLFKRLLMRMRGRF